VRLCLPLGSHDAGAHHLARNECGERRCRKGCVLGGHLSGLPIRNLSQRSWTTGSSALASASLVRSRGRDGVDTKCAGAAKRFGHLAALHDSEI
jgi:hypothetical protein